MVDVVDDGEVRCFVCGRRFSRGFFSLGNGFYICSYCDGGRSIEGV